MAKFFERNSTKLTVSEFYDNYKLGKYNFDATYQRKSNVWAEDKKAFLIDSILKNYPIPAIFMRPIVDERGKTRYDIVDGKQRLQAIISFIEGFVSLTSYFSDDIFISDEIREIAETISGKTFDEIKRENASDYIKQFWTYTLQIEYLYEDDIDLVSSAFDRLNRNGEPLNPQELRNAKYANAPITQTVHRMASNSFWSDKLSRLKIERMEDEEFVSELLLLILEQRVLDSSPTLLDQKYEQYKNDTAALTKGEAEFNNIVSFIDRLALDYDRYKRIFWTTHLYTLFSVAWYCIKNNISAEHIGSSLNEFYNEYFSKNTKYEGAQKDYKDASSSRTRSAVQRNRRLDAILSHCKIVF